MKARHDRRRNKSGAESIHERKKVNFWTVIGRRDTVLQIAVVLVVISLHFGMLLVLLKKTVLPLVSSYGNASSEQGVLYARFIVLPTTQSTIAVPPVRTRAVRKRPKAAVTVAIDGHVAATPWPSPSSAIVRDVYVANAPNMSEGPGYIAGGNLLRNTQDYQSVDRLPGSDHAVVRGIHLIDPHQQGIRSMARRAQVLFGIQGKDCIDVDIWRRLSTAELLTKHISPQDIEKMAADQGCLPGRI